MKRLGCFIAGMVLVLCLPNAQARELAGLELPERLFMPGDEQVLLLNGAGTVRRWFTPVLVAGLYLPRRQDDAARAMSLPGRKRVVLHILTEKVTAADLSKFWSGCLERNLGAGARQSVAARFERFLDLFDNIKAGDAIAIDIQPGRGSRVSVNGQHRGTLEGGDIARAMLAVWLGEHPADVGLKQALLGG